jgi:hypothetical protein
MIVAFTALGPTGTTFMDWSWHWLKGSNTFWNNEEGWIPLVSDPNKTRNAHGHLKNHPANFPEWHVFIESAKDEVAKNGQEISFIPVPPDDLETPEEYVKQLNRLVKEKIIVVVIKQTTEFPYGPERSDSDDEQNFNWFLKCNPDLSSDISRQKFREIFSIRMGSQKKKWLEKITRAFESLDKEVIILTDTQWLSQTEEAICMICQKLGTVINPERMLSWRPIMKSWQDNYKKIDTRYSIEIPMIVDKIVENKKIDLPSNIGIFEECLIMMLLMKKYGKRLILPDDNFPKTTQILHQFLK